MISPLVSVILPIYKGEKYILTAVNSILNQSYKNIELILINDCSPDDSVYKLKNITDPRIKIITNPTNLGLIKTLNKGIQTAKGKYIARMDQDDISFVNRIEEQVQFLENNRQVDILSANYETIGSELRETSFPLNSTRINLELHFHNCICHPLVIFRSKIVENYNLYYNIKYKDTEDWQLWFNAYNKGLTINNLNSILLKYRIEGQSTTERDSVKRREQFIKMYSYILPKTLDDYSESDCILHWSLSMGGVKEVDRKEINSYIKRIKKALIKKGFREDTINSFLKLKKDRLVCKFTDKNIFTGFMFMINHKLFEKSNFKYILAKMFRKKQK